MRMSEPEELVSGASQADKIGLVVTVDVVQVTNNLAPNPITRRQYTGELIGTRDDFKHEEIVLTELKIGDTTVAIDWDGTYTAPIESATIRVLEYP